MTQGVAEAGAAVVALQLLRVPITMAARTEAKLTGVIVGSAPEVASEVEVAMLAGPRDIGAGAVELFHWRTYVDIRCWNTLPSFWRLHEFLKC